MRDLSAWIWLLITLSCGACQKRPAVDSFSDVRTITDYDSLYSDKNYPLGSIRDMEVSDEFIIVLSSQDDYQFSFIDTDHGSLTARWGREGRGPGEYLRIGPGFTISDSELVFLDAMKKEINHLPLSAIPNGTESDVSTTSYPYITDFRPQYIAPINDTKIVLGALKKGRFGVLDSENNIMDCPFDYPFDFPEIQGIFRGSVFQSKIKTNEKRNRFVIMTLVSDIFEIYKIDDTGIHNIYISLFNHIPKLIEKPRPGVSHTIDYENSVAGLMKMAVSEELICFTYSSRNYSSDKYADEILCFDWDGKKVKKYTLPFAVENFCIDREYIYGVRNVGSETIIYRFKMI